MRKPLWWAALACLTGGILFVGGFLIADKKWFPYAHLAAMKSSIGRLLGVSGPNARPSVETSIIETTFIRLESKSIKVPGRSPLLGGGLAEVGDNLVLMTGAGDFYVARGEEILPLAINAPSNNVAAYRAVASEPEYSRMNHDFNEMRYHDVMFVESDDARWLFISFTEFNGEDKCYRTAVARLDLSAGGVDAASWRAVPEDWSVIFRTDPCLPMKRVLRAIEGHMAGGRLAWDSVRGQLLMASGDYHWDGVYNRYGSEPPRVLGQDAGADYGKVLRIDPDKGTSVHISMGHRNTQGLLVTKDGRIFSTEHGPRGGDELNLIVPGRNYGWPMVAYGTRYNGLPWSAIQLGRHGGFEEPVHAWVPSMGISNLIEIDGVDPSWDGDLLVGFMGGQQLQRLHLVDGRVVFSEPIRLGERPRDLLQLSNGTIALWTDSYRLILLSRAAADPTAEFVENLISSMRLPDSRREALDAALDGCMECHSLNPAINQTAPSLSGVYGRPVASSSYAGYSQALRSFGGAWTKDRLARYISSPSTLVPGTIMPDRTMDPQALDDLILVLEGMNEPE